MGIITGDLKPLESTWKGYLPIFGPVMTVVGFVIALTIFAETAKATNHLARDNGKRVDILERADIVSNNRLNNLEDFRKEITIKLDSLIEGQNNTNIRLTRIEGKLPL